METTTTKKRELSKGIVWYGSGGTDMCDEWRWDGNYYAYIQNTYFNVRHNYEIKISSYGRQRKKGEWRVMVYLCLNACNSAEILLHDDICKGLKAARLQAIDQIENYEAGRNFDDVVLPNLIKNILPVFAFINNKWELVGETMYSAFRDMGHCDSRREQYRYYHPEMPDYHSIRARIFATIDNSGGVEKAEMFGSGRSQSFFRDQEKAEVLSKLLPLLENHPTFHCIYESEKQLCTQP